MREKKEKFYKNGQSDKIKKKKKTKLNKIK